MENSKEQKSVEWFKMIGDWNDQSTQLKTKYSQLTDEDLTFEIGTENDLFKRMQQRLNKTREEIISIIKKVQPGWYFQINSSCHRITLSSL
jgi:hypothetical protein